MGIQQVRDSMCKRLCVCPRRRMCSKACQHKRAHLWIHVRLHTCVTGAHARGARRVLGWDKVPFFPNTAAGRANMRLEGAEPACEATTRVAEKSKASEMSRCNSRQARGASEVCSRRSKQGLSVDRATM